MLWPTLGITTTAPPYLVGVSHQILGHVSMGSQSPDWDSESDGEIDDEAEEKEERM